MSTYDYFSVTTVEPASTNVTLIQSLTTKLSSCNQIVAVLASLVMIIIIGFSITTVGWIHMCTKYRKLTHQEAKQCVDLKQDILQEVDRFEANMLNKHRPAWCVCKNNWSDKLVYVDDKFSLTALHVLGFLCRGSGVLTDTSPVLFFLGDMDVRRQDIQSLIKDMRDTYIKLRHMISKYFIEAKMNSSSNSFIKSKGSVNSHMNSLRKETYKREFLREAARIFVALDFDGDSDILDEVCKFFDLKSDEFISVCEQDIHKLVPYAYLMSLESETLDLIFPMEVRHKLDAPDRGVIQHLEEIEYSCSRSKRYLEGDSLDECYNTITKLCENHGLRNNSGKEQKMSDAAKVMQIRHLARLLLHNIFEIKQRNTSRKIEYAADVRKMYAIFSEVECDSKEVTGAKVERFCAEIKQGLYFICSNANPDLLSEEMLETLRSCEKKMSSVICKSVNKKIANKL